MNDSPDIVNIFLIDRIAGIALLQHGIDHIFQKNLLIKGYHIGPVGHNIMGLCLIKGNNILDHLRFVLLDHALFMGLIHNGNNLLLCYRRLCPVQLYPKGYSRQPGNPGDKQSKRPEHHYPEMHQLQITVCIFLRMIGTHPAKGKDSKS